MTLLLALAIAGGAPAVHAQSQRRPNASQKPSQKQKEAELKRVNARIEQVRKSVNADVEKRDRLGAQLRDAEQGVQRRPPHSSRSCASSGSRAKHG